ncbi:hypothetical protein Mmc1_0985 [Magnetococcus marinus MC-1]|uniref:Uncharacterized protein n=1 Tax=Magnetococcus marinus (strain ATCC BAA-1437 / JCM 17883 / MC-1) TaxID=156889 RepID=A0L6B0_MAGMM|nr:hypothetical protein [Magnetococcus marinus]ABK43503.1 hypothetical protein Mmc1_0985 [Magnetococcus marinus MC-1]
MVERSSNYTQLISQAQHKLEEAEYKRLHGGEAVPKRKDMPPSGWVSMADYVLKGKRPPRKQPKPSLPDLPKPTRWVEMYQFELQGMRPPKKVVNERDFLPAFLRNPPPPPEPPPEQSITVFDALAEVYQVTRMADSVVFRTLNQLAAECAQEQAQGIRDIPSAHRCQMDLQEVSTRYAAKVEEICDWYLENYFRDIRNPNELA